MPTSILDTRTSFSYDNRPFNTTEEQDQAIIDRWNNKVGLFDEVWVLGDVSWYNVTKTIEILNQLNGEKRLCLGNHDDKLLKNKDFRNCFVEITNYKELKIFDTGLFFYTIQYPVLKIIIMVGIIYMVMYIILLNGI